MNENDGIDSFVGQLIEVGGSIGIVIPIRNLQFSGLNKGDMIKVWYTKKQSEDENMAYKEVIGSPIVKLDENNKVLEGTLLEIEEGKFGPQFKMLKTTGETVVLGNQTVLETKITKRLVGKKLKIEFVGKVKAKDGKQTYSDYKVFVDE